ncbi:MAG: hypothetical protein HFH26_09110 [Clostridiaceae bacterium]|nr:hypothetical protein [Clostridiaceae bacterium]
MPAMRDVFWDRLYDHAKQDRDIVILSADFSAPSLDRFRLELPAQYIRLGIAEQNMILMAAGLALEGKRPFCYAISPFLTMRCFEQIRLYAAGMNLPITLVGVGAGFSYADSGYTHHALEDVSLLRTLPHMRIFQPCDNASVREMTELILQSDGPAYLRLDRYGVETAAFDPETIGKGFQVSRPVQKVTLAASGYMVKTALTAAEQLAAAGIPVGVVDICTLPCDAALCGILSEVQTLVTLEEHTLPGGLGSYLMELASEKGLSAQIHRLGLDLSDGYPEEYSGRETLHRMYGIDAESIVQLIKRLEK